MHACKSMYRTRGQRKREMRTPCMHAGPLFKRAACPVPCYSSDCSTRLLLPQHPSIMHVVRRPCASALITLSTTPAVTHFGAINPCHHHHHNIPAIQRANTASKSRRRGRVMGKGEFQQLARITACGEMTDYSHISLHGEELGQGIETY